MNPLERVVTRMIERHRGDKSVRTLARMKKEARAMSRELYARGFRLTELGQLRGKSVGHLLDVWDGRVASAVTGERRALAPGVQAVQLTTLRALCRYGGKPTLIPKSNERAGLPARPRVRAAPIAWAITPAEAALVPGENMSLVLRAQSEFGLRLREAWLLDARTADRGTYLEVYRGTKASIRREVPIRTEAQRELLAEIKRANERTPRGTLIPGESQEAAFRAYRAGMKAAGLRAGHGLRHGYAQRRHEELVRQMAGEAGSAPWVCPMMGGVRPVSLGAGDRAIDREARLIVSRELGHQSPERAAFYLGGLKDGNG